MGVVLMNHLSGVVTVLTLGPLFGGNLDGQTILWGSFAGLCGAGAVLALYTGFARNSMAVVSPIAAVIEQAVIGQRGVNLHRNRRSRVLPRDV